MNLIALILLAFSTMLLGCQWDPFAGQYTTIKPNEKEIIGLYKPDARTVREFKEHRHIELATTELLLNADGSFRAKQMPDCWFEISCSGKKEDASGNWKIIKHQDWWAISLWSKAVDGQNADRASEAMLRNDKPPHLVHFNIGDPDSGEGLVFGRARQ